MATPLVTPYMQQLDTASTSVFSYSGVSPSSVLYDTGFLAGGGTITHPHGEYVMSVAGAGTAILDTCETCRLPHRSVARASVAVRVPTTPVGAMKAQWGMFDSQDGFGFGRDVTGNFIFLRYAGVDTVIPQAQWFVDKMDGTGTSGLTFNPVTGNVYTVSLDWYGVVEFAITVPAAAGAQTVTVYRFIPPTYPAVVNPCVPVRVSATNSAAQAGPFQVMVAGRGFDVLGDYKPNRRHGSHGVNGSTGIGQNAIDGGFTPLVSVRRNPAASLNVGVYVKGYEVLTGQDALLGLFLNPTLVGENFTAVTGLAESVCQGDGSATLMGSPPVLYKGFARGFTTFTFDTPFPLCRNQTVCLGVKTVGTTVATVSARIQWYEDW